MNLSGAAHDHNCPKQNGKGLMNCMISVENNAVKS